MKKQIKPYGTWNSPLTSQSLVESSLRLGSIQVENDGVIWTEGRPEENGRTALMCWSAGGNEQELSSSRMNVRSKVHEYGGKSFTSTLDRHFYIDFTDQQIHVLHQDGSTSRLTDAEKFRYIDIYVDELRNRLIAVGEDHSTSGIVENMLVAVSLSGTPQHEVLASGHDFYASPSISPDGSTLVFLTWDHPNMPWDGTQLWMCDMNKSGNLETYRVLAGSATESIFQPQWDPAGNLYFISDRTGWWNLYEYSPSGIKCILEMEAEFGLPQWVFGMSTYAVVASQKLLATYQDKDGSHLVEVKPGIGITNRYELPHTHIEQVRAYRDVAAFIGSGPDTPAELVVLQLETGKFEVIRKSATINFDKNYISKPTAITYEVRNGDKVFAWFYPPKNLDFEAPEGEKPPLIVLSHGGPTSYSPGVFALAKQYWTSRGFAIVDVNYSGSTGFGREYRERLRGNWGLRDVEDCAAAANYLVKEGLVDPDRLIIKGGSAGGYTTLAALAFGEVFSAGASYYGVADLELLANDSHKFESRYLDGLIGQYPAMKDIYYQRSPVNSADQIDCPVIFFQGRDDPVVPPEQAEVMVAALRGRNIPVAYLPFDGESHGFRQAATIVKCIESELYFYSRIFDMDLNEDIVPIEILNL